MEFSQVNYLAVGLSAVLAFVLGMLWYSPLLRPKAWMSVGHGWPDQQPFLGQAALSVGH